MSLTTDVALSMQIGLQRQLDVLTQNIAKMSEPGAQADRMLFAEFISPDGQTSYMNAVATARSLAQGPIQATGNPYHAALISHGYFGFNTPQGPRYGRGGAFVVDATGRLTDAKGNSVMDDGGGDIIIPQDATNVRILEDGTISSAEGIIARLGIFTFENDYLLTHTEGGFLETTQAPIFSEDPRVLGGNLEGSNVDGVQTTSELVAVNRMFSANQAFIEAEIARQQAATQMLLTIPSGV